MATESDPKPAPKVVKLNKALRLDYGLKYKLARSSWSWRKRRHKDSARRQQHKKAEAWMNSMSKSGTGEPKEIDLEGRPARLGLGAKVALNAKVPASVDPVERKLLGKLNAAKRRSMEDSRERSKADECESNGDDDDEPESRTNAFSKKRSMPLMMTQQSKRWK